MQNLRFLRGLCLAALSLISPILNAQTKGAERLFETHWRYTYTLHVESNSLVQQAGERWRHFLWFRYDSICKQDVNGKTAEDAWRVENQRLHFSFRQKNVFTVARLNDFSLDLETQAPDGKGTYLHHFVKVKKEDSPFARESNTLPVVQVQTVPSPAQTDSTEATQTTTPPAFSDEGFCVELVGGGFYGGINPVQHDYITISPAGRLVHEFESARSERLTHKTTISKEELEKFLDWAAAEQRFFELENTYDCKTPECEKRKTVKPMPVPLRLRVAHGNQVKMVTVSIWGLDKNGRRYVSYPPELDRIVDAIQRMANREQSMK